VPALIYVREHMCAHAHAQADWLRLGFILSIFYIVVWMGVGGAWWKVIGLW